MKVNKQITLVLISLTIFALLGIFIWTHSVYGENPENDQPKREGAQTSEAQTPQVLLEAPEWKVKDWFEINVSNWRGGMVAYPPEKLDWEKPYRLRYEVIEDSLCYGYPCYVLQEFWLVEGERQQGDRFFFRKADMMLIAVWTNTNRNKLTPTWMKRFGPAPWIAGRLGLVPRFPLLEGEQPIQWTPLMDANNTLVKPSSEQEHSYVFKDVVQIAKSATITREEKQQAAIALLGMRHAFRWVPGQLWWAQCWELPRSTPNPDNQVSKGGHIIELHCMPPLAMES